MKNLTKLEKGVYCLDSWVSWPIVSVLWWIHGNEPCWIKLLDFAIKNIDIITGKIYFMYWNIEAIKKNIRQCDVNLNRIFKEDCLLFQQEKDSSEYKDMIRIKKYLSISDACLDIHSSPTSESPIFAICEPNGFECVKNFPVSYICSGFASVEPGGTDYFMYKRWKIWVCIECWYHLSPQAFECAKISLFYFLDYFWMRKYFWWNISISNTKYLQAKRAYITKTNSYRSIKIFQDFESISKGILLGYDWGQPIHSQQDGYILFARDRNIKWVEAFIELVDHRFDKNINNIIIY